MFGSAWKPREPAQLHTPYLLALALLAAVVIFVSADWAIAAAVSGFWAGATGAFAYGYNNGYGDACASHGSCPMLQPSEQWPRSPAGIPATLLSDDHDHAPGFSQSDWEAQEAELVSEFTAPTTRVAPMGREPQDAAGSPSTGYGEARTATS